MRYIADGNGYLQEVSFGADIECNGKICTEYTGDVPAGYDSLADWFTLESDKLHRWHIVEGQLTLDAQAPEPKVYVEPEPYSMTLLWENASPTSTFASQTIALDLSPYDKTLIEYDGGKYFQFLNIGVEKANMSFMDTAYGNTSMRVTTREVTTSHSGVNFYSAFVKFAESNAYWQRDDFLIPFRIYGIKGINDNPELFTIGDLSGYTVNDDIEVNSTGGYLRGRSSGGYTSMAIRKTIIYNSGDTYDFRAKFVAENADYTATSRLLLRCFDVNGNVVTSGITGAWVYNSFYNAFMYPSGWATFTLPSTVPHFQIGFVFECDVAGEYVRVSDISLTKV